VKLLTLAVALSLPLAALAAAPASEPDPSRFPPARQVIHNFKAAKSKVKIAFFDADSTLRVAPSGKPSANGPKDVAILPMISERLIELEKQGYLLAVASNQAGVQFGHVSLADADAALRYALEQLSRLGVKFHYYDFAEREDENRKPQTGMARRLAGLVKEKLGREVDWKNTIMVGDSAWKKGVDLEPDGVTMGEDVSNADRLFGENMAKEFGGVTFHHPRNFFAWMRLGVKNFHTYDFLVKFVKEHPELDPGVNPPAPTSTTTPAAR
jgi:DNA 3'-phosphatase